MVSDGLAGLASVFDGADSGRGFATAGADPLLGALQAVGRAASIGFVEPPAWEATRRTRNPLAAVCRASRVRHRRVTLPDRWWKTDAGPLLGFVNDGGALTPTPLIPDRTGRYTYVDPLDGSGKPVSAAAARRIEPYAHTFYRPFPDQALSSGDLVRFVARDLRADLRLVLGLALGGALLALVTPIATGMMFRTVIPNTDTNQVWTLFGALVAVNLGAALFDLTRAFALVRLEGKSSAVLQAGVIDRLFALPPSFFRDYTIGDLGRRAMGIDGVRRLLSGAAATSLLAGIFALANLMLLFYYSWRLALVAVAFLLFVTALTAVLTYPALKIERRRVEVEGTIAGLVFQFVGGIAKLRVAAAEGRSFAVWAGRFREQKRLAYRTRMWQAAVTTLNDVVPVSGSLLLFAGAGIFLRGGHVLNTGDFIAFNAAFGMLIAAGIALSNTMLGLLDVGPVLDRAQPILQAVPEVDHSKPDPGELAGLVEASHLKFRYLDDGPLVLDDVSFRAAPGEFVALVGSSGSGKSTILRLLLGFERPDGGAVYFDGQDLATIDLSAVRSQIGTVLQGSRLLAADILTNIVGAAPLREEEAWEAAEQAGVADDIKAMPMGMRTLISEGGGAISAGQRQRLLIARALVRKPRIMLFDEATSALDNRTQRHVKDSLDALHATRIVIAHRLSTIREADRIHVVDAGNIVQSGSFDELAARSGLFADLISRQLA